MELFKDVLWLRTWRDWLFAVIVTLFVFTMYYILLYPLSERVYSDQFVCKEYMYTNADDNLERTVKVMYFPYIAPFTTSEAWITVYENETEEGNIAYRNANSTSKFYIYLIVASPKDKQWGAWGVRWGCPALQSAWGCQSEKLDLSFDERSPFEMRRVTYALMLSGGKERHSLKVGDHIADFQVNARHVNNNECDNDGSEWPTLTYNPGRVWFWMVLWRNLLLPPWTNLLLVIFGVVLTHLLLILRDQFDRCGRSRKCLKRFRQKVSSFLKWIRNCRVGHCLEELWRLKRDIFLLLLVIVSICAVVVITAKAVRIPMVASAFIIFLAVWWWRWFLAPEEWPPAITEARKRAEQKNFAWLSNSVEAFFQGTLHLLTKNRVLTWRSIKTSWMRELGGQKRAKKPSSDLIAEYLFVWGVLDKVAPKGSSTKLWMETLGGMLSVFEEDCWVLSLPPIESKLNLFIKMGKTIVEENSVEVQAKNILGASDKWINFSVCLACSRREEIRNNWRGILIKFVEKMDVGGRKALFKAFEDRKKAVGKCPPWPELRKLIGGQSLGGEDDQTP